MGELLGYVVTHEVGHTLGFRHNYIASADDRSSVMDYPHPLVTLKGDTLSLENAYGTGIGAWDKVVVAYGYQDFPEGTDERADARAGDGGRSLDG